jgi:tetratricopeptide (TPR) repeat protein
LKTKRWSEAALAFDEVLRSGAPGKANHLAGRALARLRQEPADRDGALSDLSLALALQPSNRAVRTQRGRLALSVGQTQIALGDFNEVLNQEPSLRALLGRAQALAALGQHEKAVKDAEDALRQPGVTAVERYTAAEVYATAVGNLDEINHGHTASVEEEQLRARYQERAIQLVRTALQSLPANERSEFWTTYPARDRALGPVRSSFGFQRLQQEFHP